MNPQTADGRACDAADGETEKGETAKTREGATSRSIGGNEASRVRYARAPRRATHGPKLARFERVEALLADERYLALDPGARLAILEGAIRFGDADLKWWHKLGTWAETIGVGRATVGRAVKAARESGLLEVTPYLRPAGGGQGSSTYRLALDKASQDETPCAEADKVSQDETPCHDPFSPAADPFSPVADGKVSQDETPEKVSHDETPEPDPNPKGEDQVPSNGACSSDAARAARSVSTWFVCSRRKPAVVVRSFDDAEAAHAFAAAHEDLEVVW